MVAPERLRELRGLAVAHSRGHARDRQRAELQQGGGPLHAHPLQLRLKLVPPLSANARWSCLVEVAIVPATDLSVRSAAA